MAAHCARLRYSTRGDGDVTDITADVGRVVHEAGVTNGVAVVHVPGSTAAITTMEFERGGVVDMRATLDRLIPREGDYEHNRLNADSNSHAHIRAAIVGPSESIPVVDRKLCLGTWQQIVLVDFDDRPRQRTVAVHVLS